MVGLEGGILGATDERSDGGGRLSALGEPVVNALEVELEILILDLGIIPTQDFKELAVTRAALIGGDDTVGRMVLATSTTHSDLYHFCLLLCFSEKIGA